MPLRIRKILCRLIKGALKGGITGNQEIKSIFLIGVWNQIVKTFIIKLGMNDDKHILHLDRTAKQYSKKS
jgi:hypothetical protein